MNEVEKMYENANVELKRECEFESYCPLGFGHSCESCDVDMRDDNSAYPPFTAGKQISIIKWLLESYDIGFSQLGQRIDTSLDGANCISGLGSGDTFEESLAQAINDLWQDLIEEERKQIKEILE